MLLLLLYQYVYRVNCVVSIYAWHLSCSINISMVLTGIINNCMVLTVFMQHTCMNLFDFFNIINSFFNIVCSQFCCVCIHRKRYPHSLIVIMAYSSSAVHPFVVSPFEF